MKLVLFDLDNTLLSGDSDYEWAQFLIDVGVLDRTEYEARNQEFYAAYQAGTLNIQEFLDFQLKPLSLYPRAQLDTWHERFMQEKIRPMMSAQARALVEEFSGNLIVVVTATNSFITRPIVSEFGIQNLIATEPEEKEQQFTGSVNGIPSFREGKVKRVKAWLESLGLSLSSFDETLFYSDSINDLPLLEMVDRPVVVDPDPKLKEHASKLGWEQLTLHR